MLEEKKLFVSPTFFFFFFYGFIASVKKHRGIRSNFVQFYEMHTNDIIMVTVSNVHMQNTKICTNVNCTLLRCLQTEHKANFRGSMIAYKFSVESQLDTGSRSRQRDLKRTHKLTLDTSGTFFLLFFQVVVLKFMNVQRQEKKKEKKRRVVVVVSFEL